MSDELPEGWAAAPLGALVDVLDNRRVPVNSGERANRVGKIPYYGATGQVGWIDDFLFDEELVLLGEDGAPFLDKSKPIAYLIRGKTWVNNHAHVLRARAVTSNPFIKHALDATKFDAFVNGTTRLKLTQGTMNAIPLPVPPGAEQHRIVGQVEALLEQVNRAKGRLDRVPLILKRFRQAVLAAACSGELTKEWREAHAVTADDVLKLLGANAVAPEDFPSAGIPGSWSWVAMAELCDRTRPITYGVIKLGEPVEDGVPTLRSSNVRLLTIDEGGLKRISPDIAKQFGRTFLKGGEVVITVRGTLGGIAVVPKRMAGYNISREVAVLPVLPPVDPEFVAFAVANITSQNWLNERAKGVAYTGINIEDLRMLPLPTPPPEEQAEVVRHVEKLFALADTIERRVQAATARADKLPQAILSKAFSGELVPTEAELARAEGRTYETAEELLKRVNERTPRAAEPSAKRARKASSVRERRP